MWTSPLSSFAYTDSAILVRSPTAQVWFGLLFPSCFQFLIYMTILQPAIRQIFLKCLSLNVLLVAQQFTVSFKVLHRLSSLTHKQQHRRTTPLGENHHSGQLIDLWATNRALLPILDSCTCALCAASSAWGTMFSSRPHEAWPSLRAQLSFSRCLSLSWSCLSLNSHSLYSPNLTPSLLNASCDLVICYLL